MMLAKDSLKDRCILITGGGSGLGKSMAKGFLECGARVVICGRTESKLHKAKEELSTYGEVFVYPCDVRNYHELEQLIEKTEKEFHPINGLVNNAAGNFISPTEKLSPRAFDIIIDIVLKGTKNATMALGKKWIESKSAGTIINIATTYAHTGSPFVVPSAVAKAGVVAMTKSLAVEWARYNIRTNAIAPGLFPTKGAWDRLFPKGITEKLKFTERIPLNRTGERNELVNLSTYLMSDYSAFINGEVITIDGGEWLQSGGQFSELLKLSTQDWEIIEKEIRSKKIK